MYVTCVGVHHDRSSGNMLWNTVFISLWIHDQNALDCVWFFYCTTSLNANVLRIVQWNISLRTPFNWGHLYDLPTSRTQSTPEIRTKDPFLSPKNSSFVHFAKATSWNTLLILSHWVSGWFSLPALFEQLRKWRPWEGARRRSGPNWFSGGDQCRLYTASCGSFFTRHGDLPTGQLPGVFEGGGGGNLPPEDGLPRTESISRCVYC